MVGCGCGRVIWFLDVDVHGLCCVGILGGIS